MSKKINLDKAKDYYIKNEITYKDLANMFNYNYETIRKRSYKEQWDLLKADYKNSLLVDLTEPATTNPPKEIEIKELETIRKQVLYKLLVLVDKGLAGTLPTETTKIKIFTGSLLDLDKVLTGIKTNTGTTDETFNKLDYVLSFLTLGDEPLKRNKES